MRLVVLVVLVALVAGAAEVPESSSRSAATGFVWALSKTEINPDRGSQPPNTKASARVGHIDYDALPSPQAEFDIDFSAPPKQVQPGGKITFNITVSGRLTGGKDTQGFRGAVPILYVNDRWVGSGTSVDQNCVDPIGAAPISCTEPRTARSSVSWAAPTYGDTFTIGIGVLNCGGVCYVRYTYAARKAGAPTAPSPKPKPKPTPSARGQLRIDYEMPARFGLVGKNGLVEYHDTTKEIRPDEWRVNFTVFRRDGKRCAGTLELTAAGAKRLGRGPGECEFFAVYPREGTYTVKATLDPSSFITSAAKLSGTLRFPLQDWLIVGLGDSNGSGEGAPDAKSRLFPFLKGKWQDRRCHRSAYSYQAQTAMRLERRDKRTSVTFVHLACSGANIHDGILGPYQGIEPVAGQPLPSQIVQMRRLVGAREIDAVMVSIGVNDLKFGALVKHCIAETNCPQAKFPEATSPHTLAEEMTDYLKKLPKSYARMARALKSHAVKAERVYLSEYFDSTHDEKGNFCDPLIGLLNGQEKLAFDKTEAQYAHDEVLLPLNKAVATATTEHDWKLIGGAYKDFGPHGYCVKDPKQRWIVRIVGSFLQDVNAEGTLHSTPFGNARQADRAYPLLINDFYPDGPQGPPRPPTGR